MRNPPLVLAVEEPLDFDERPEDDLGLLEPACGVSLVAGGGVLGWVAGGGVVDLGSSPGKPALRDGPTGPLGWLGVVGCFCAGCWVGAGIEKVPLLPARV